MIDLTHVNFTYYQLPLQLPSLKGNKYVYTSAAMSNNMSIRHILKTYLKAEDPITLT